MEVDWENWEPQQRSTLMFIVRGNKVLLIRKKRGLGAGKINGPGGKIDKGETPKKAAVRECKEEVGVHPVSPRQMGELYFQFTDGLTLHCTVFMSGKFRGKVIETDEAEPFWFAQDEIPYDEMWADDRHWLPQMLDGQLFKGYFVFDGDNMLSKDVTFEESLEEQALAKKDTSKPISKELCQVVESLLIASRSPLTTRAMGKSIRSVAEKWGELDKSSHEEHPLRHSSAKQVERAIEALNADYEATGRAFRIMERAQGWRIFTAGDFAPWVRAIYPEQRPPRLSAPAMETLAIVAYRQPVTKADIEAVRGVSCDGVIKVLLERDIIRIAGRAEVPGRPLLYESTELFLEHFGIANLDELPNAAELRTVELPTANYDNSEDDEELLGENEPPETDNEEFEQDSIEAPTESNEAAANNESG